jgi:phage shock protein A
MREDKMGFFSKLWTYVRGLFIGAGDDIVSGSPESIRATYAAAIDDAKKRYKEMERAVALLASERSKTEASMLNLEKEEKDLQKRLEGALSMAETEHNNPAHREAGTRYLARINEISQKQEALAADLETQRKKVEEYKSKLRSFTDEIERLKREQGEMVAEFISNQQVLRLEDRLRGLGESAVDESIVAIREKVAALKAQARLATEMRAATVGALDADYERVGAEKQAATRFDELLKARAAAKAGVPEKERDLG